MVQYSTLHVDESDPFNVSMLNNVTHSLVGGSKVIYFN